MLQHAGLLLSIWSGWIKWTEAALHVICTVLDAFYREYDSTTSQNAHSQAGSTTITPSAGDSVGGEGLNPTIDADSEQGEHQVLRQLLLPSQHGDVLQNDLTRCGAIILTKNNVK